MVTYLLRGDLATASIFLLSSLFSVFIALPLHELAHAATAYKLGDPTAKNMGRLTFNPMVHIDPVGGLMILLFGFGWAKPVPINMRYFASPKRDMALSSVAGPLANVLVGFFFLFLFYLSDLLLVNSGGLQSVWPMLALFFSFAVQISLLLAVFNLIPIPPLDGSRVLAALLPQRLYYQFMRYEPYFYPVVIILMVTNLLTRPLHALSGLLLAALNWPLEQIFSYFY